MAGIWEMRMKLPCFSRFWVLLAGLVLCGKCLWAEDRPYQVAVYYWPNYHVDAQNEEKLGAGWTEWELVKKAIPRFEGHQQPRVPLWGYTDEANPRDMARKIDAMADHGITAIIFDWYQYNTGQFLEGALRDGFLKAPNRGRVKFALMWANHGYSDNFPASPGKPKTLWHEGRVTRATFDAATDRVIKEYFSQPNYWKIDGAPYFSIYEMQTLVDGLGGIEQTREALEGFRARTKAAGFPDLHLNAVDWGINRVKLSATNEKIEAGLENMTNSNVKTSDEVARAVQVLGVSSVTSYTWAHYVNIARLTPYPGWAAQGIAYWDTARKRYPVPYYPHVSVGWDSSPRTDPAKPWDQSGYPYTGIVVGNTPEEFKKALVKAKNYLDTEPKAGRILTVNSWNEWTEGSNLEPDTKNGLRYLEAIGEVFPPGGKAGE